jgi:hypothetical protein
MAVITNFQEYLSVTSSIVVAQPISFTSMMVSNPFTPYISNTSNINAITPIRNDQINYREYMKGFTGGSIRLTVGQTITDVTNTINLGANSTIEMWLDIDKLPLTGLTPILAKRDNTSTSPPNWLFLYLDTNGYLTLQVSSASVAGAWGLTLTGSKQLSEGRWNHIAIVRQSTTNWTVYVNGIFYMSGTVSGALNNSTTTLVLGAADSTRQVVGSFGLLQGYITGFRINTTTAVYQADFIPTTLSSPELTQAANIYGTPSQAIASGTVLLVNPIYGSTSFTDNSGTSRTFTGGSIDYTTAIESTVSNWISYIKPTSSVVVVKPIQPFSTVISGVGQTVTEQWI